MKIIKPPFTQIVAGVVKSGDPSTGVNPTVQGQLRTTQWVMDNANNTPQSYPPNNNHSTKFNTNGHVVGDLVSAEATLVFSVANFNELFELHIGNYVLKAGTSATYTAASDIVGDFLNTSGMLITDMMDSLCTAISTLPEFSATNDGIQTVTIAHKPSLGINSDSIAISFVMLTPTVVLSPFDSISQFSGGSPTVGSVLIS